MPKRGTVYILASRRNGTLYVGVTSDLAKRVWMHKHDVIEGFTRNTGYTASSTSKSTTTSAMRFCERNS